MPKTNRIVIILISLLATIALTVTGLYYYNNRIQNIFDEMYYEIKIKHGNSVFTSFDDVTVNYSNVFDEEMNDTRETEPYVIYHEDSLPPQYTYNRIYFDFFYNEENGITFFFEKEITTGDRVSMYVKYNKKENTLRKEVDIAFEKGLTDDYLEEESKIKAYLKEHDISAKELDRIYDELMNDKILTDWTKLYDSQYSPSDYGNVKVVTQWENW
ncbi:TipC family immunity protein [Streptococcus sp. CSL10205-OR2]|uniref:TipC family immunity protein n=1 Tax=Streptococcus sp. CSL10205-OR2 TaxID=2980558 RepID=UPI0021DA9B2B|nr:TipC family immunity protein [Streptococcus sp. CSL10205-OR2]MCU9534076.1 TipC family immunity protein [Streptococcus sp. CSL10205-OR2]